MFGWHPAYNTVALLSIVLANHLNQHHAVCPGVASLKTIYLYEWLHYASASKFGTYSGNLVHDFDS